MGPHASPDARHAPSSRLLDLGRLLRLSLAPSAVADVAAGCVLAAGAWPGGPEPFVLMAASLAVYHGGMALNDWADRAEDARLERLRPIPLGRVPAGAALALAVLLLCAGPLLAATVSRASALVLGGVTAAAALYDLAGRGPWRGPVLLGLCRAGNLSVGLALTGAAPTPLLLLAPVVYGAYVLAVSRVARLEDDETPGFDPGPAAALGLRAAAGVMLAAAGVAAGLGSASGLRPVLLLLPFVPALAGAVGLLRAVRARAGRRWSPGDVGQCVGMGLRRLLVVTATLALAAGPPDGVLVAGAILLGYPASHALRRVFPPT